MTHTMTHPIERMMNMVDEGMYQQECTLSTHPINTPDDTTYNTTYDTTYNTPDRAHDEHGR